MYNLYDTNKDNSGEYKRMRVEYRRNRAVGKKPSTNAVNAGGAVIIIIFVILCLTIFGMLSFTTAFADKKLADRNLLNIQQYYQADAEAEAKLAQIYNAVLSSADINNIKTVLNFDISTSDSRKTVSYTTPMNDIQAISSKIAFSYDISGKLSYKIIEWKIVFTPGFDKFKYGNKAYDFFDPIKGD